MHVRESFADKSHLGAERDGSGGGVGGEAAPDPALGAVAALNDEALAVRCGREHRAEPVDLRLERGCDGTALRLAATLNPAPTSTSTHESHFSMTVSGPM